MVGKVEKWCGWCKGVKFKGDCKIVLEEEEFVEIIKVKFVVVIFIGINCVFFFVKFDEIMFSFYMDILFKIIYVGIFNIFI